MSLDLAAVRKTVNRKLAELNTARTVYRVETEGLAEAEKHAEAATEAQELAQQVAQSVQQQAHDQIAGVVSRCLSAVFDEPYTFRIHFERKRGRTEARLVFEKDGMEIDPLTASGGGAVDVASFALRLSCLMLAKPSLQRLLILDEPFRFVSENLRGRVKTLLETLAEEMKVQFLLVTHFRDLQIGAVYEIGQ